MKNANLRVLITLTSIQDYFNLSTNQLIDHKIQQFQFNLRIQ